MNPNEFLNDTDAPLFFGSNSVATRRGLMGLLKQLALEGSATRSGGEIGGLSDAPSAGNLLTGLLSRVGRSANANPNVEAASKTLGSLLTGVEPEADELASAVANGRISGDAAVSELHAKRKAREAEQNRISERTIAEVLQESDNSGGTPMFSVKGDKAQNFKFSDSTPTFSRAGKGYQPTEKKEIDPLELLKLESGERKAKYEALGKYLGKQFDLSKKDAIKLIKALDVETLDQLDALFAEEK